MTKAFSKKKYFSDLFVKAVVTFLGTGYFPWAPGTMGSLAGILIAWFAGPFFFIYLLIFAVLGFAVSKPATRIFTSSDPSFFVIDEVVGAMISVILIPGSLVLYLTGFLLFRLLDVAKPWPIAIIQKMKHPWAIMGDDVLAGIFANLVLRALIFIFPGIH